MAYISIPKSSGLSFVINVTDGSGSIGEAMAEGADAVVLDANYLYEKTGAYFNCELTAPDYCQQYQSGDLINFQFSWQSDTLLAPIAFLVDESEDEILAAFALTALVTVDGVTTYAASYRLGEITGCLCLRAYIYSYDISIFNNFFGCGDNGTFEAIPGTWNMTTGGDNTLFQSLTQFRTGAASALIVSDATPNFFSTRILTCGTLQGLGAQSIYIFRAWVKELTGTPFINTGRIAKFDTSPLTGATIIFQQFYEQDVLNYNSWNEIALIFYCPTAIAAATIQIITNSLPAASGGFYIDDWDCRELRFDIPMSTDPFTSNDIIEAASQEICACNATNEKVKCTLIIKARGKDSSMELFFDGSGDEIQDQFVRIKADRLVTATKNDDFAESDDSAGTTEVRISRPRKVYRFATEPLPPYMVEKLTLLLGLDYTWIQVGDSGNWLRLTMLSKVPEIDTQNRGLSFSMEWEMYVAEYPYQNSNCNS